MKLPLWLFICSPLRMIIYAVVLFAFDFLLLLAVNSLIAAPGSALSRTAKCLSWVYIFNLITQAGGFAVMAVATAVTSGDMAQQLKSADYFTFNAYSIPLFAYAGAAVVMYLACRFFLLRSIDTDLLTRKVASVLIALFTSPWIILLPIAV